MTIGRFLTIAALATVLPAAAAAQASTGTLVVTMAGQAAESSIRVHVLITTIDSTSHLVRADSGVKELSFPAMTAGRYRVETRAIGFMPDTAFVQVRDGRDASVTVNLKRAVTDLAPVMVAGITGHMVAFEKRRAQGKGTFLTEEDIRKTRRGQVSEVLRSVRGLRVECANGCRAQMVRSTNCEPRYYINGFPSDAGILMTPLLDVAGVEIYRGPSETPGEFMGSQSMCGAIVIWTK
jgi:hypothetical protein